MIFKKITKKILPPVLCNQSAGQNKKRNKMPNVSYAPTSIPILLTTYFSIKKTGAKFFNPTPAKQR